MNVLVGTRRHCLIRNSVSEYILLHKASMTSMVAETKDKEADREFAAPSPSSSEPKQHVQVKVGMVGDAQIGKTSLMVKYVEGKFDEDYIQTLGVNFMEKSISLKNHGITFSIWDLGGKAHRPVRLALRELCCERLREAA